MSEPIPVGKWLLAEEGQSASGKTRVWRLCPKDYAASIGEIRWHGPWRKYSFFPRPETVYEADCLRAIAAFCQEATIAHRQKAEFPRRPR